MKEECKEHEFQHLRTEHREREGWHTDVDVVDIFYCVKCLKYEERQTRTMTHEEYAFREQK